MGLTPGNWGNKGGGRPPNELRAASRDGYAAVLTILEKWVSQAIAADVPDDTQIDRMLQALDKFGKYGLGEVKQVIPSEFKDCVLAIILKYVPQDERELAVMDLGEALSRL